MKDRNSYWIEFKVTKANQLLFINLVATSRAKIGCFHQGKRATWSIEFPFENGIELFKEHDIFKITDMPIAVLR